MSRLKRPVQVNENPNPATKFLHWKSNDKCFEYYNKETQEKVQVQLPLKVLFLEHYHTVKGWSDSANSGIWANEVYSIGREELEVKNSNGTIVKGIYKDNRTMIKNAGGVYHRSVYCMTEDGEIINLQLKGAVIGGLDADTSVTNEVVLGWSTFYGGDRKKNIKGVSHLLDNQFIEINEAKQGKKGSVKYSIPAFTVGANITKKQDALANECTDKLQKFMDTYFSKEEEVVAPIVEEEVQDLSELAF